MTRRKSNIHNNIKNHNSRQQHKQHKYNRLKNHLPKFDVEQSRGVAPFAPPPMDPPLLSVDATDFAVFQVLFSQSLGGTAQEPPAPSPFEL